MQGIYRILNLVTDKWYVGSAQNIRERWKGHKYNLRNNRDSKYLQNAFNKYGAKNFILEILKEVKGSYKDLLACEQIYLDEGFALEILYNIARTAGGGDFGPEVNQKISKTLMGHEVSKETRVKQSKAKLGKPSGMLGKHHSEETRAKQSKGQTGLKRSDKHCVNLSIALQANECAAKPYPAFYNDKTGEYIPVGINLTRICRERHLNRIVMGHLKRGACIKSQNGWRLAIESEK